MGDRFLLWLGAGAVCAGVTVGMLAGAGTAFAQTESDGDDGAKTSQSAKPAESQSDSDEGDARPKPGRDAVKAINAVKDAVDDAVTRVVKAAGGNDRATAAESTIRTGTRPKPGQRAAAFVNDVVDNMVAAVTQAPDRKVVDREDPRGRPRRIRCVDRDARRQPATNVPYQSKNRQNFDWYGTFARRWPRRSGRTSLWPRRSTAQPKVAAAAAPQPQIDVPPVISAIGTAIFNLISFGEGVIEGPPKALPGSGVTVKRSTLTIGDQEVPADWYFPDTYDPASTTPPERIIYLQHGFLARGVFYDYTASYLAKSTNSVVVAPTITSNIFATDGMWLGGDQMHRAVADLFKDSNPALLESAQAAGLRAGPTARAGRPRRPFARRRPGDRHRALYGGERDERQARRCGDARRRFVHRPGADPEELDGIPVYNLSATPYPWNLFGTMDAALAQVRPGPTSSPARRCSSASTPTPWSAATR